jgi:hypothetical protein
MSSELFNVAALDLVHATAERCAIDGNGQDPARFCLSKPNLIDTYYYLPTTDELNFSAEFLSDTALKLIGFARGQAFDLLAAEVAVIPPQGPEHIARVLHASTSIGKKFGRISREPYHGPLSNDEYIVRNVLAAPLEYMDYDDQKAEVQWNEAGEELLKVKAASLPPEEIGCPAIGLSVKLANGSRGELFNMYWTRFTADFIKPYVEFGFPYQRTAAM